MVSTGGNVLTTIILSCLLHWRLYLAQIILWLVVRFELQLYFVLWLDIENIATTSLQLVLHLVCLLYLFFCVLTIAYLLDAPLLRILFLVGDCQVFYTIIDIYLN